MKQAKSIEVKYYPPISIHNPCQEHDDHDWICLDFITWKLASGKHEVYWKKCIKCNTKMLREETY